MTPFANQDAVAADNFTRLLREATSLPETEHRDNGSLAATSLVGTPAQIVDRFIQLNDAGCDGVQVNFYDFLPDLEFFGKRVVPLMKEAGLRGGSARAAA